MVGKRTVLIVLASSILCVSIELATDLIEQIGQAVVVVGGRRHDPAVSVVHVG